MLSLRTGGEIMIRPIRIRLTGAIAVRMIADTIMINFALASALIIRFLWLVSVRGDVVSVRAVLLRYVHAYEYAFWLLTLVSLFVFYVSGFYTHGRIYGGRYKAFVIVQAVTLSYLMFVLWIFLVPNARTFPRSAVLLGWFFTLALVLGARLRTVLWRTLARAENRLLHSDNSVEDVANVLVVGGGGYIGSALVERLLELGYNVRVLDLMVYGDDSISAFYNHPAFELVKGDFRYIDAVVRASKGMDAIVHLGAIVGDSACSIDQDLTIEVNLQATRTIAEVGKGFGVRRFVFASTCSVYGASDEVLDEQSVLRPLSLYARTKMESEKVLLSLADDIFAPTILRFGTIYGLSGRPRFDLVVNLLAAKAVQDGEVGIFGGEQWRPFVHVRDVAEAIVLALRAPLYSVRGTIFNVGSNEQNLQIAELGPIIKEMVPDTRVVTQPKEDNRNYRVRFDKISRLLNFQPHYTVHDGIREIISGFATGKITDYRNPCYNNFDFLKLNGELRPISAEDMLTWGWVSLSVTDAMMLAKVVMVVIESGCPKLMNRLLEGIAQAIQGDIDGFLNTLTDMRLAYPTQPNTASVSDHQRVYVAPGLEEQLRTRPPMPANI